MSSVDITRLRRRIKRLDSLGGIPHGLASEVYRILDERQLLLDVHAAATDAAPWMSSYTTMPKTLSEPRWYGLEAATRLKMALARAAAAQREGGK